MTESIVSLTLATLSIVIESNESHRTGEVLLLKTNQQ